jgi:hypothetical protein
LKSRKQKKRTSEERGEGDKSHAEYIIDGVSIAAFSAGHVSKKEEEAREKSLDRNEENGWRDNDC